MILVATLLAVVFSGLATYAAAAEMDLRTFTHVTYQGPSRYAGLTSAALTFGLAATGITALYLVIWLLAKKKGVETNLGYRLALILVSLGGVAELAGAIVAKIEWDG